MTPTKLQPIKLARMSRWGSQQATPSRVPHHASWRLPASEASKQGSQPALTQACIALLQEHQQCPGQPARR
jgi:hypothetical protein